MASVSSTNSLGNTSLRGYGGMASGIDRDAIIEQMTSATNTKIWNQESAITKLEWKQEAYRGITDKILDLQDNYSSYSSANSLKDPNTFAKSLISVLGKEDSTRFVTASGTSELVSNVSIQAVRQLASSSVQMSEKRQDKALTMTLKDLGGKAAAYSNLSGAQLNFVNEAGKRVGSFTFADSYDKDGTTHEIDYFPENDEEYEKLAEDLNNLLADKDPTIGEGSNVKHLKDVMSFKYDKDSKKMLVETKGDIGSYKIQGNSTALAGLGYKGSKDSDGNIALGDLGNVGNLEDFEKAVTTRINTIDYLRNEKLTFNYDGSSKDIMLITNDEASVLRNLGLSDEKLMELLGTKNEDGTRTPLTEDELNKLKQEIIKGIREEQSEGAAADAKKIIESGVLKELNQIPESDEYTNWLKAEVQKKGGTLEDKELTEKLEADPSMDPTDKEKLVDAAVKKLRADKGDSVLLQENLAQKAETEYSYNKTQAEADLTADFRKEAVKELKIDKKYDALNEQEKKKVDVLVEGKKASYQKEVMKELYPETENYEDLSPEQKEAVNARVQEKEDSFQKEAIKELGLQIDDYDKLSAEDKEKADALVEEKFGDEEEKASLIKAKQAGHYIDKKIEEKGNEQAKDEAGNPLTNTDGTPKTLLQAETEKALDAREKYQLEQKSMTARLTENASIEQQDAISKELNDERMKMVQANVQKRLDKAFGTGNVEVGIGVSKEVKDGKTEEYATLTFTTKPDSSVSVSSRDGGVLYTLGIENGESNKINVNGTLDQSALKIDLNEKVKDADGKETEERVYADGLVINGVTIGGIGTNTSISSILSKINSSNAGVKATYVAATGQFMLVSEETGAGREISLDSKLARDLFGRSDKKDDSTLSSMGLTGVTDQLVIGGKTINLKDGLADDSKGWDNISNILAKINAAGITIGEGTNSKAVTADFNEETRSFVLKDSDGKDVTSTFLGGMSDSAKAFFADRSEEYLVKGQDAKIDVSYGNGVTVSMERSSNTFNLEGMTVTVSGVFGGDWSDGTELTDDSIELKDNQRIVEQDGKKMLQEWKADTSAGVSFSAKADVDKVTEKVKKFFEDFNAIVTEINTQVTTRPDSSYGPLTDEQKDEMNETSIENWEKKAKSGLLFNDSTMRDLSMDIQSVYTKLMRQTGLSYEDLQEMGITYSDNEKDGGVLVFDETSFRTAMENKPDKVSALFTGGSGMGNGLIKIVEDTFTPYATRYASRNGNSYGRLVEEAGSEKIPTSIMKNQIYNEIKSKQEQIEALRATLKSEEDRYISMFTTMETMINKMNSQASYLSQITG